MLTTPRNHAPATNRDSQFIRKLDDVRFNLRTAKAHMPRQGVLGIKPPQKTSSLQIDFSVLDNREESHIDRKAFEDPLTELLNDRAIYRKLDHDIRRAVRYGHPFSICIFEFDAELAAELLHNGHERTLNAMAKIVRQVIRDTDYAGRIDDYLVCVLPQTDLYSAERFAERVKSKMVSTTVFYQLQKLNVTVQTGTAGGKFTQFISGRDFVQEAIADLKRIKDVAPVLVPKPESWDFSGGF